MKPKPAKPKKRHASGTKVAVLRPNRWAGCRGEVSLHYHDETWKHLIIITKKDGSRFTVMATLEELKELKP